MPKTISARDLRIYRRQVAKMDWFLTEAGQELHDDPLWYSGMTMPAHPELYDPRKWARYGKDGQINTPIYRAWEQAVGDLRSDSEEWADRADELQVADVLAISRQLWEV